MIFLHALVRNLLLTFSRFVFCFSFINRVFVCFLHVSLWSNQIPRNLAFSVLVIVVFPMFMLKFCLSVL